MSSARAKLSRMDLDLREDEIAEASETRVVDRAGISSFDSVHSGEPRLD